MKADLFSRNYIRRLYFDPTIKIDPVKSGTSGHRGIAGKGFNFRHVEALTQACVDLSIKNGHYGPKYEEITPKQNLGGIIIGRDVRYLSDFALKSAVKVLAGNEIPTIMQSETGIAPTPVISLMIHKLNRENNANYQGIIITASHNPPEEGGIKTNGLDGGPNTQTKIIDELANDILNNQQRIKKTNNLNIQEMDLRDIYVKELKNVVDMDAIKSSGIPFVASPLGGSAGGYYNYINSFYGTKIIEVLGEPDPQGKSRTYDWDGKLRGDPSSKYVMKAIEGIKEKYHSPIAFANDNDADRFGAVDSTGSLNPNHILCVIADYLCKHRNFDLYKGIGRSIGTTHMLDSIAQKYGRPIYEVPVGFKWYVDGLLKGKYLIAGEESAGLIVPRIDGSLWVTEKDGIVANLLMMEIISKYGKDIGNLYKELEKEHGVYHYERIDYKASKNEKERLKQLSNDENEVKRLLSGKKIAGKEIINVRCGDGIKITL